jgi:Protein of unknown function (DUF1501)
MCRRLTILCAVPGPIMFAPNSYGRFARRDFLRFGSLAMFGAAVPAASASPRSDTSVILLYLHGGPSHLETYDLKPDAPEGYRSVFQPIRSTVPGMDFCEWFPRQAKIAGRLALVRSLHHDVNIHSDGGIVTLTGKRPTVLDPASQSKSEHPDFGSVVSRMRESQSTAVPQYVAIPTTPYMTRPTYAGRHHAGFAVGDPSSVTFRPPGLSLAATEIARLDDRRILFGKLERSPADPLRNRAFDLLGSRTVAEAFDLARESEKLRDRYGRNLWGQGCLLARRLAEAGTGVVSLFIDTPKNGPEYTNWDDHIQNAGRPGHFAGYMKTRLPYLDECLSALIEDIYDRGLDRKVMVVAFGEFGRTPRLSTNANGTGRDHWPQAYSALVSGGGLRVGQVVGSTNARGEYPSTRPYTPQDLLATIYRHLGIDPSHAIVDASGRPTAILFEGRPIPELAG